MAKSLYFTNRKQYYLNKRQQTQQDLQDDTFGLRILFGFGAIVLLIIIVWIVNSSNLMFQISEIFKNNLDVVSFWQLKGNLGGGFVFSIYVTLFAILINGAINPRKINYPLLISIFFITLIIFSGIFIIQDLVGTKKIDFNLNPLGVGLGTISCNGSKNIMLAGDPVSCNLENKNIIYEGINVSFTYIDLNKSYEILSFENDTFIAPEKLRYISFGLIGENYPSNISVGFPYHFKTFEEYEKDKPIFLAYILSLIILAFVTIPSAVLTIKKLIFGKD